jgi:effector-binding domain-containing protein
MKVLKIILILILALMALLISVYAYYGGFTKIRFSLSEQGGEVVVYEEMTGDYQNSPIVMDRVYNNLLTNEKIETTRGFGIYYDNPETVETSKLRSELGCIVEGLDSARLAQLSEKYLVKTLPVSRCVSTTMPFKGGLSVMIGIMRVYPALNSYLAENKLPDGGPVLEIYDTPNKTITYRQTISE